MLEALTTAPWKPLTVTQVRKNKRIVQTLEDDLIEGYIDAATELLETDYQISILARTWRLSLPSFCDEFELPRPPLRYVGQPETAVLVKYLDTLGAEQTFATDVVATRRNMTWRVSTLGSWPQAKEHPRAVRIEFMAGYDSAVLVPPAIRQSLMLLASYFYQHRDATFEEPKISMIDRRLAFGVDALMKSYRVIAPYGKV